MKFETGLVLVVFVACFVLQTRSELVEKEQDSHRELDKISDDFGDESRSDDENGDIYPIQDDFVNDYFYGDEDDYRDEESDTKDVDDKKENSDGHNGYDDADKSNGESTTGRKIYENVKDAVDKNDEEENSDDDDNAETDEEANDEYQSKDSKSGDLIGDDDAYERISQIDQLLGSKDYVDDNFLAKEGYDWDGLFDVMEEYEDYEDKENDKYNIEVDGIVEENFDDDKQEEEEEEVAEEEWTAIGEKFKNDNQNQKHLDDDEDRSEIEVLEKNYFGSRSPIVFGVVVGSVFLAGLVIGFVVLVVACRMMAKSRGFIRLEKSDEFSSRAPIYEKTSNSKCDIVNV